MADPERFETSYHAADAAPAPRSPRRSTPRDPSRSSPGFVPLLLVVVALLGSVVVPARQTWQITRLLRETTEVIGPARLLVAQLQAGVAEEIGAHEGYVLQHDHTMQVPFEMAAATNDRRLAALETRLQHRDSTALRQLAIVRQQLEESRRSIRVPFGADVDQADLKVAEQPVHAHYDAAVAAIGEVAAMLYAEALARESRVRDLEHLSLFANVALVLVAFAALFSVVALTRRERRLSASLQRRVEEESARARQAGALRDAAESLAGAYTMDDVTQQIARAGREVLEGDGAFVEQLVRTSEAGAARVTVAAVAGAGTPPLGAASDLAGSRTERVLAGDAPQLIPMSGGHADGWTHGGSDLASSSTIGVPLASSGSAVGALFVVSARGPFQPEAVANAAILGHMAALAYERVGLLDKAIEGQRKLERVAASRSRLMRGFSHDVKNPIAAADGFAALLEDGVYGEVNPAQRESLERMRRCMQSGLSLVDDLHELARAETGHLEIAPEPVDLAALVGSIAEEWQAAASAAGLSFTASVADDTPIVRASLVRVRQIVSNLISNAIKYTDAGAVTLRAMRRSSGPWGEQGDWGVIECIDTGRGIPPERYDFIFEEFSRIGDGDKPGAGLGLAISRLLAQALGGHLTVESEPGRGSRFTLWLPAAA